MASSIEALERAAVQLWEAKRLAEYNDVVHGRLALLLLDNAAETSLRRSKEASFIYVEMYGNLLTNDTTFRIGQIWGRAGFLLAPVVLVLAFWATR